MHAKIFLPFFVVGLLLAFGLRSVPGRVEEPPEPERIAAPGAGLLLDLGNETCPVMGGEVDQETYIEWNHLRVGFCCPGCDQRFLEDPEEALDTTATEWREAAEAVRAYLDAGESERARRLEEIRRRWKVIRE